MYSLTGFLELRIVIAQLGFSINGYDWSKRDHKHDKEDPHC
jgi:hypothetical protein